MRVVKAHACGNDFLIVETGEGVSPEAISEKQREIAVRLCERHTGLGADGVEYLEWTGERSGRIRLFNADGSVAEISGNGTRCVAAWMAHEKGVAGGDVIRIETDAGLRVCRIVDAVGSRYQIASAMGVPAVATRTVTLADGRRIEGAVVSTGNPHFVIFVEGENFAVQGSDWQEIGREICFHADFPQQTNVEFVHVVSEGEIEIRIFERGVGPTSSSGTGTSATAAATISLRGASAELLVHAPGGAQQVEWRGANEELVLTGPAELVFAGEAF